MQKEFELLLAACRENNKQKVQEYLDLSEDDHEWFIQACEAANYNHKIIALLLKNPNIDPMVFINTKEDTLLTCAITEGDRKLVKVLLADHRVDPMGNTVNLACKYGDHKMLKLLLSDKRIRDLINVWKLIHKCLKDDNNCRLDCIPVLLDHCADEIYEEEIIALRKLIDAVGSLRHRFKVIVKLFE